MARYKRVSNQNPIDFVLTVYGDVGSIFEFYSKMGYERYEDFINKKSAFFELDVPTNSVNDNYDTTNHIVATDDETLYSSALICNNDLSVKTLVVGDFNDDYNNDFDRTDLEVVIVGYEGMDLYIQWSVTNNGVLSQTVTPTLKVTGFDDRVIQVVIEPNSTYQFQQIYYNMPAGDYTIELIGLCPQTLEVKVLGSAVLECNNDLHIVETAPYRDGQTINIEWSVTNSGTANTAFSTYIDVFKQGLGIEQPTQRTNYEVIINAGQTYTFTKVLVLSTALYNITNGCGNKLAFNVLSNVGTPTEVYIATTVDNKGSYPTGYEVYSQDFVNMEQRNGNYAYEITDVNIFLHSQPVLGGTFVCSVYSGLKGAITNRTLLGENMLLVPNGNGGNRNFHFNTAIPIVENGEYHFEITSLLNEFSYGIGVSTQQYAFGLTYKNNVLDVNEADFYVKGNYYI